MLCAYLGLGTATTSGINPDVLGLDMAALVKRHVLQELFAVSIVVEGVERYESRTFSVLEITVESP